ncbi:MAG: DUF3301 domain-containing protein [Gammaproteobacteria bacterium]|nr:DUF3301 domain-containing protein [Gammaproteobacteria bacterium]
MSDWWLMALLAGVIWFWQNSVKAKELANIGAKMRCDFRGLLFLDQSVALLRLKMRRNLKGQMVFERHYQFEFSRSGDDRLTGDIVICEGKVVHFFLSETDDIVSPDQL